MKIADFIVNIPENREITNSPIGLAIKVINSVSRIMALIAMAWVVPMMVLITADVFSRYVLNSPITGVAELASKMMILMFLAVAWCGVQEKHVSIDIVMNRFSKPVQRVFDIFGFFVSAAVLGMMAWFTFQRATYDFKINAISSITMPIPEGPFLIVIATSFILLLLVAITLIIKRVQWR